MGQTAPCWTVGTPDVVPGSTENATTGYFPVPPGSYDNLYNQQGSSGWKAYGESMPSNCFIASAPAHADTPARKTRHNRRDLPGQLVNGGCRTSPTPRRHRLRQATPRRSHCATAAPVPGILGRAALACVSRSHFLAIQIKKRCHTRSRLVSTQQPC